MIVCLFNFNLSQGGEDEEEEEGEHISDEDAACPAAEQKTAVETPAEELGENEEEQEQMIKEVKAEEKGNLAGERQSGDGQVWDKTFSKNDFRINVIAIIYDVQFYLQRASVKV